MGRWEPGAATRLREAATDLYLERGFEATTVADIAERAGLTARTFFRHFADKREVLFAGSDILERRMVNGLRDAPESADPMEAVGAALVVGAEFIGRDREFSRRRQEVITANRELLERELVKLSSLATALAAALRQRGVREPAASLAAEAGVAVFRVAFARWTGGDRRRLATIIRSSLQELAALTATGGAG
jgi:AcrR family transcriptional regulator